MNYQTDNLECCHLLEIQKDDENKSVIPRGISEDENPLILASSATTDSHCSSKPQIAAKAEPFVLYKIRRFT